MARRKQQVGILTDAGNSVKNSFSTVSNGTGIISDTFKVGREYLKPALIEAKEDTMITALEAIANLQKLGFSEEESREYIMDVL